MTTSQSQANRGAGEMSWRISQTIEDYTQGPFMYISVGLAVLFIGSKIFKAITKESRRRAAANAAV